MYLSRAQSLHGCGRLSVIIGSLTLALFFVSLIGYASAAATPTSALPQPTGADSLSNVSCVSTDDCWAVGAIANPDDTEENVAELLHWNGTQWVAITAPTGAKGLGVVGCSSSSNCWAFGAHETAIHWNGGSWTKVSISEGPLGYINSVSCTSSRNCWAVGSGDRRSPSLALHWNGSKWSRVPAPHPDSATGLTSVACTSANSCWALGTFFGPVPKSEIGLETSPGYLMALHWNGSSWTRTWTSAPYNAPDGLSFSAILSCPSSSSCFAVGTTLRGIELGLIALRWQRGTWATAATPRIGNAALRDVDCTSASDCWAVGSTGQPLASHRSTLVERWNGSGWVRFSTPRGNEELNGVSCTSSTSCWAVGDKPTDQGNVALRWDGSAWSSF